MKRFNILFSLLVVCSHQAVYSQNYVDTVFSIHTEFEIPYDTAIDFAGNNRILKLDVSYPLDDSPSDCGRPLMVIVHGGAWIAGDKSENNVSRIRADYAKRGYTTASVNYRLGQFNTSSAVNCNTQAFNLEWNCLNMGDSTEWYRAYYRGIQDVNSAVRYLVNNSVNYEIDPNQVFMVGESAGGFIAMGVGFIDDMSEVQQSQIAAMPNIAAPNSIYESTCVQGYNLDTSIASMNLLRPALGAYNAGGNYPLLTNYTIKGVGNIFGGVFNNIFNTSQGVPPGLFLFHQPNDLIVPIGYGKVFRDYNNCLLGFPFNCANIVNRPYLSGSSAVAQMIDDISTAGQIAPDYVTNFTTNTAPCSTQPGHGHAYDNFWLRTSNMATYFATKMVDCELGLDQSENDFPFSIYPNPSVDDLIYLKGRLFGNEKVVVRDLNGKIVLEFQNLNGSEISISTAKFASGLYIVSVTQNGNTYYGRIVKM